MVAEVLELLAPSRGGLFVDCTVGLGGHARALLDGGATQRDRARPRSESALGLAREALAPFGDRVELVHADYRELDARARRRAASVGVDGALADLGVSSMQLDADGRGFSFRRDEPLDMRMDRARGATRRRLLRDVEETELADVIFQFGEERYSRRVARAIVMARQRTADRRRPDSSRRSSAARFRAAAISGSTRRRGPSRRCGSGSTASSTGSTRFSPPLSQRLRAGRAAGGDHVSLARGSHRQAHVPRAREGGAGDAHSDQASAGADRDRGGTQPPRAQRQAARD